MLHPILVILTKRAWCSIEYLVKTLNLSKSNIKNQIAYLTELGIKITYKEVKGYKLESNIPLLNYQQIVKNIPVKLYNSINLHIAHIITSTNDLIKDIPTTDNKIIVLCAEYQTKARGRREKKWVNKFGSSICMSLRIKAKQDRNANYALGLVVAIAIVESLKSIEPIDINIKWPNDVIVITKNGYHKLAGILIETHNNEAGLLEIIIGIGINVNLQKYNITSVNDNKIIDLATLYKTHTDRNIIVAKLINYVLPNINKFLINGFREFIPRWYQLDAFYNKNIVIKYNNKIINAKCLGINDNGGLITKINNNTQVFYSADISLRPSI